MSDTDFNAKPTELDADEAEMNAEAGLDADPSDALAPLDQVIAERDDWKDRALRVAAEMENLKRRSETQQNDARAFAIQRFARDLLGVAESTGRSLRGRDAASDGSGAVVAVASGAVDGFAITASAPGFALRAIRLRRRRGGC